MNGFINILNNRNKKAVFYLTISILLYFVFLDEVAGTFLISISSKILSKKNWIYEDSIVCLLLGLQIIFSSLQSGFSDYYLRRKSLIVSISATLVSIILLRIASSQTISILVISVIIKGVLGNTLPIAWAGIADETRGQNIRFFLALSICALAIGSWGSLITIPLLTLSLLYKLVLAILIVGILIAMYVYMDPEDMPHSSDRSHPNQDVLKRKALEKFSLPYLFKKECTGLYKLIKKQLNYLCLASFLFSEISFYQILFRIEVFNNYECFIRVPLAIGLGYTIGTIILKFIKATDRIVSAIGLLISIISILSISILFGLEHTNQIIFTTLFSFYSFGYALFTPSLFSIISVREALHNQGKSYGLLESTDSLASLITFILLFKTKAISCAFSLNISTQLIVISGIIFIFIFKKAGGFLK